MKGSVQREQLFDAAESKTLSMCGSSMRENRETPQTPTADGGVGRSGKAESRNPDMHVCGESDVLIGPTKWANKVDEHLQDVRRRRSLRRKGGRPRETLHRWPWSGHRAGAPRCPGCVAYGKQQVGIGNPYPNERLTVK